MASHSYAVAWAQAAEEGTGRLDVVDDRIELNGRGHRLTVPLSDVTTAEIARSEPDRLRGLPALVLQLKAGPSVRIASLEGPGVLQELAALVGLAVLYLM